MRSLPVALIVLFALVWPAGALAEPPPVSAVSQYVEAIPTGDGGGAVGVRADETPARPVALAPQASAALEQRGGGDAKTLEELATRPEYGAPRPMSSGGVDVAVDFSPVSAALSATSAGASTSLLPLFVGMALIALATVLAAGRARED